jgi:hypothetical protein
MRVKGASRRESHWDQGLVLILREPPLSRIRPRLPPYPSGAFLGGRWLPQAPLAPHGAGFLGHR